MLSVNELRYSLYEHYKRKELAKKLNISPVQVSRLLNNKSKMRLEQYNIFINLLNQKSKLPFCNKINEGVYN